MSIRAPKRARRRGIIAIPVIAALLLPAAPAFAAPAAAAPVATAPDITAVQAAIDAGQLPDPLDRGPYGATTIQETKLGTVAIQEPNATGGAPNAGSAAAPEDLEIRGSLTYPADRTQPSPLLVLVHGNHGSCDTGTNNSAMSCADYKRNEAGYAYLAENLATWGYTTFSVSQDQLMMRQDGSSGRGMHQRRMLIAGTLDALSAANEPGGLPLDEHTTIGDTLAGHLDMTRIGLMGHSRGGDAVSSFVSYNRIRTDGPRYPLRGVISLAPVDYERTAPFGVPYMTILPWCDGDVSNLQGARMFERSQYLDAENPFPSIQVSHLGANHNWYNTVWYADDQDGNSSGLDPACGNTEPQNTRNVAPTNSRLSGAASTSPSSYVVDNSDTYNPEVNTKISGDPDRMGDQEKIGLATMASFFRRYIGGEGAFEPYMTGELSTSDSHRQIPDSACPTSESGTRIDCEERVSTTYVAPSSERVDLIRPEVENPLTLNALGGALTGTGFANPYLAGDGVDPLPETTASGLDWCNPEPDYFDPGYLNQGSRPTAAKSCPLPAPNQAGGQNSTRENSPINHSYGRQLSVAWEEGTPATLTAQIPAASGDMSGMKALALNTDVNYFDERNPGYVNREGVNGNTPDLPEVLWNPASDTQDFEIVLIDSDGTEASVDAGDPRWGNALHYATGTYTPSIHMVLEQVRVPMSVFAAQGVDISSLSSLELRFGTEGMPASGSIQLADVRFQEATAEAPLILSDGTAVDQGAGFGAPATGPDPAAYLASFDNTPGEVSSLDQVGNPAGNTTWVVDDDRQQCANANFTSIQDAVDYAAPFDTIVVCEGVYEESSTPVNSQRVPVADGAMNGLTITKALTIKGAGADKVTIMPDQSLTTLAGATPYLRDGGGNVITISRQSRGSTDTSEMFVDISGVTVTGGSVAAEAGIAFHQTAGRIESTVVQGDQLDWGIVKTTFLRGAGTGTVETELTVDGTVVSGARVGGILFDGARGQDGSADTLVDTGLRQHGYVTDSVVTGSGGSSVGVRFANGFDGFVDHSRITGAGTGVQLLAADAESIEISDSVITGNGVAVANMDAAGAAPRTDAPVVVSGSLTDGRSADGSTVTVLDPSATEPAGVATEVGETPDAAPAAAIVDPGEGLVLEAGDTIAPLVRALDDFAVQSVTLFAGDDEVATSSTSPYTFSWTATEEQEGTTVALTAVVTDSSGQQTTSDALEVQVAGDAEEPSEPGTEEPSEPGTGEPGTGEPGTEEPGTELPGTGDPADGASISLSAATVEAGGTLSVSGEGFVPGSSLRIELHSTPVVLVTAMAEDDGSLAATVTIPATTVAGEHTIVVYSGTTELASAAITVTVSDPLAVTGGTLWTAGAVFGALLLVVGAALLIARRREARMS